MSEAEAPLLISREGVEFSAGDRSIKLLNGRSSFKLKISQVKRHFTVCLIFVLILHDSCGKKIDHLGYKFSLSFCQLSSKNDNRLFCIKFEIPNAKDYPFLQVVTNPIRCISISPKRLTHIDHPLSTESPDLLHNTSSVKRVRLGKESVFGSEESYQQCNSHTQTSKQVYI